MTKTRILITNNLLKYDKKTNMDENDLLYSNSFIPVPELSNEVSADSNSEFKQYYERERSINEEKTLSDSIEKMSIRSVR